MKIKTKEWWIFILLAALSFGVWYKLEYPNFAFVDLSVDKQKAFRTAEKYFQAKGVNTAGYKRAIVFGIDSETDRYLQYTSGLKGEKDFIAQHDYELFFWKVRFFRESQKEEYVVYISPRSGSIDGAYHLIDDVEPRPDPGKEAAKQKAEAFLRDVARLDLNKYDFHEEKTKRYERRTDYLFSWEKKGVYIPWKNSQGGAKLLVGTTVSGDEIRAFYKNELELPEKFSRYMASQSILGSYLRTIYYIIFLAGLIFSIIIVLKRRLDVIPRLSKKWFCYVAGFLAIASAAGVLNGFQGMLINYPTSVKISSFLGLAFTDILLSIFSTAFIFILPGIAGESLRDEVLPDNKYSSFFYYINSNFFNRGVARAVLLGYVLWIIMLGLQAAIFSLGQRFLGVWREWYTMTQFSSTYIPIFSAFLIGASASLNEEIIFRIFGISLAKKYLRNSVLAVLVVSLIWGMGHTMYSINPVWFRIIEIGLIGCFFGFVFLKFGIIPLLVAHYLFNVFWSGAAYMLGRSTLYLFLSAIIVVCLPLVFAMVAWFANKGERERDPQLILSKIEEYNLRIIMGFISAKKAQGISAAALREELIGHNWDHSLVDLAIKEVFKN